MIEIKRFPSGEYLNFLERDVWRKHGDCFVPENMLDGYLGFMWLIFSTSRRKGVERNFTQVKWEENIHERNRLVNTILNIAKEKNSGLIQGKDIEEEIEYYHKRLDAEAKRRGGVLIDAKAMKH